MKTIKQKQIVDFKNLITLHREFIICNFVNRQDFTKENIDLVDRLEEFLVDIPTEDRQDLLLLVFDELGKDYEGDLLINTNSNEITNLNKLLFRISYEVVSEIGFFSTN